MKDYIGVRIVKAEPEVNHGREGYKVAYPGGKVVWIDKDTFEKQYKEVSKEK